MTQNAHLWVKGNVLESSSSEKHAKRKIERQWIGSEATTETPSFRSRGRVCRRSWRRRKCSRYVHALNVHRLLTSKRKLDAFVRGYNQPILLNLTPKRRGACLKTSEREFPSASLRHVFTINVRFEPCQFLTVGMFSNSLLTCGFSVNFGFGLRVFSELTRANISRNAYFWYM